MGVTFAVFHCWGNTVEIIEMFISLAKEGTITGAAIFNILTLILSNPAVLEPLVECRFSNIKLSSIGGIQKFTASGFRGDETF